MFYFESLARVDASKLLCKSVYWKLFSMKCMEYSVKGGKMEVNTQKRGVGYWGGNPVKAAGV